ncbi:hypothetical protein RclHR1_00910030 [Rhizophagus clarus]|uniref:Uncharacterized protein n=1 Tax=Rhizophagus clarus TaxID=94130 RepID=A0A2Z6SGU6_9GLOM|nr:hypothetical protein RclHR1_00910030 [Rhizophagus clarus]
MSSGTNAQESENAMRDVLRSVRHVLAMDAFANKSTLAFLKIYRGEDIRIIDNRYQPRVGETVEFIYDSNSGAEAMRIGYDLLRQGKRVTFVSTGVVMARALAEKASKLFKSDNLPVRAPYTNTVEAGISFEVTGHFDIVIAITNIATLIHVEALAQMLYRIHDCSRRIVSLFYQKNSNELFCPPGRENIQAELTSARPNNLPTAIKGHRKWNNNTISYKVDEFPAIITFIEVEHQKCLFARYFIEKLCSFIASTSFTGIDDKHILSGSIVSEAFAQSCERFIEIQNQSLSLFGFKSHAKTTPDLNSAIKAINAIAGNWCGYTIKSDKKRIGPKGQQV